jgi:hypothetical protein
MKKILIIMLIILFALFFVACPPKDDGGDSGDGGAVSDEFTIYIAGQYEPEQFEPIIVAYWTYDGTDITKYDITDGSVDGAAEAIYVEGNNVYIVGELENAGGKKVATLWIDDGSNITTVSLSDPAGTEHAYVKDVYYDGTLVHAVGYVDPDKKIATYWTYNGTDVTTTDLTDGTENCYAYSIDINDSGIVYIGGRVYSATVYNTAVLWEIDGATTTLIDIETDNQSQINDISIDGTNIHMTGVRENTSENEEVTYWLYDGMAVTSTVKLSNGFESIEEGSGVVANGTDIYVSGFYLFGATAAGLWKYDGSNVEAINLTDGTNYSKAYGIATVNDNYYVVGYEGTNPSPFASVGGIWKYEGTGTDFETTYIGDTEGNTETYLKDAFVVIE